MGGSWRSARRSVILGHETWPALSSSMAASERSRSERRLPRRSASARPWMSCGRACSHLACIGAEVVTAVIVQARAERGREYGSDTTSVVAASAVTGAICYQGSQR